MNAALRASAPQVQQQVTNTGQLEDSDFGLTPEKRLILPDGFSPLAGFGLAVALCLPAARVL
jgi:hypothetical protein